MKKLNTKLDKRHFHLLGVGGMGMTPLALFLKQVGSRVSGDDDNFHPRVHQLLLESGIEVSQMPDLESVDAVVYSNAIGKSHPVLMDAKKRGLPIIRRGEFLASLSENYQTIVVAGSHGKTTTCGLLIHALKRVGFKTSYILGGFFSNDYLLPGYYDEDSPWLIVELDESDGSIHSFNPTISLLVNLDWDHVDYHRTQERFSKTFVGLIERTQSEVFLNESCKISKELDLSTIQATVHTFGESGDVQMIDFQDRLMRVGGVIPPSVLSTSFDESFNAQNAVAALSVVHFLGNAIPPDLFENFPGLWRRQELLYDRKGFSVLEDYGHHPTEIRNLFDALREKPEPLTVVFQPHRFSRTLQFKQQFAEALIPADRLIIMEVYGAGEDPIAGGTGEELFEVFSNVAPDKEAYFCPDQESVIDQLNTFKPQAGVLLFLGAGDIQNVATCYVAALKKPDESSSDGFLEVVQKRLSDEAVIRADEPLANKTTIRVGGSAKFYGEPANETDLQALLQEAANFDLPVYLLGRGSNLIVPDSGVRGLVIRLSKPFFQKIEILEDGRIRAGAGVRLKELCGIMRKHQLTGFEFLEGVPGNVGGALRMNAGAMGGWFSQVVSEVVLMNFHGAISVVKAEDLHFGYRHCKELNDAIGLAVTFKACDSATVQSIQHTMDVYQNTRKESQPRLPSAGCSFKNPQGSAAGKLIDETGLKGFSVGGAEVSDMHANFIVNRGNATASDVISLINQLRKKVYQKTGYELDPEVILFGDKWENYLDHLPKETCTTQPISPG